MKISSKILVTVGALGILSGVYAWGIPAIVNLPARSKNIEQKIYQSTGMKVKLGHLKLTMGFFPSVWVQSDKILVLNKNNTQTLSVINPKLKLKLFPLLFRKIEFSHVYSDSQSANFVLGKDKQFYLGDYPLKFEKKGKFSLHELHMDLGKYDISLEDRLNSKSVSLNGEYLKQGEYIKNDKLKLATKGVFVKDNKSTDYYVDFDIDLPLNKFNEDKLRINADIQDFDLSSISDYVEILSKGNYKNLKGIFNYSARTEENTRGNKSIYSTLMTKNLEIIGKDAPSSIIFHDDLKIKLNFDTISNGVKFKDSSIEAKDLHVKVDGKLVASGKKIPAMDLTAEFAPTKLKQLWNIIPGLADLLPEMDLYKLKKYPVYGDGYGKIRFKGEGSRPQVFGNIKLRDMYIIHPIVGAPKNASVDLDFKGKVMNIDVNVPVTQKASARVNGFIKIDGTKYSELKIKSSDYLPLAPAQEVVIPLHEVFKFKMGPVPIMKLSGLGTVDVFSAGKKIDPHLFGSFYFKKATASFNDIHNLELRNASGEILFQNTKIPFKTYNATINEMPAKVYGDCNVVGDMNVFAQTSGQSIPNILKVINTSKDMADVQRVLKPFTNAGGIADLYLNIYGNAKDIDSIKFNKDIFAKGKITLHNATTIFKDTYLPLHNINGVVNFDKKSADYNLTGYIRGSKIFLKGTADEPNIDLTAWSDKCTLGEILDMFQGDMYLPFKKDIGKINISFKSSYKGIADSDNLDYSKFKADGKLFPNYSTDNIIKVAGGKFNIANGILRADGISGLFSDNPFTLSFVGTDIYKAMKIKDAKFKIDNFNVASINNIRDELPVPKQMKSVMDNITDIEGNIAIKGYMKNGGIYSDTDLKDISFVYKPANTVVNILSGKGNMRGNTLYLGKVNTKISTMPVLVDGSIANVLKNPDANLYVTAKITQGFVDRFFNINSVYPVKVRGDVNLVAKIRGTLNKIHANSVLNVKENSSLYYMGATLAGAPSGEMGEEGIATNPVSIIADAYLYPNKVDLKSLLYNQIITSQNNKKSTQNQLAASGEITLLKDNVLGFKNLKLKTKEPTDAKIFNVILKKPTIKQGIFTSDLSINGTSAAPIINGELNVASVDIPLFDSTIRDINLDFQKDYVYLKSRGTILTNDIEILAKILNNPSPPITIEELNVNMDVLDLNVITNRFNDFDVDKLKASKSSSSSAAPVFSPEQVILKKGIVKADQILIKKAKASKFESLMSMGADSVFNVENYSFNLANGIVSGKISSDLKNFIHKGQMSIKNADAQIISENFFDMPGQMYGIVTGDLNASCNGITSVECVKTLSGDGHFDVLDGRMPKLGSLEYLLKATNLITGGITGLSINGIIDLITPLKSGNFDNITGDIKVNGGVADDIKIYSSGKDLNMYLTGSYNLSNLVANMEIYGSLSKNFSTVLGVIGNMSLNRLFNKIPGISINDIKPGTTSNINKIPNFDKKNVLRVFKAEIFGDINGSSYVKSFRWIKN